MQYLIEDVRNRFDIIEVYNKVIGIHRNDEHRPFSIVYSDQIARAEVEKTLKQNLIAGDK